MFTMQRYIFLLAKQKKIEKKSKKKFCGGPLFLCRLNSFSDVWNAAINIAQRENHPVSSTVPKDSTLTFLTGRAQSTAHTPKESMPYGKHTNSFVSSWHKKKGA